MSSRLVCWKALAVVRTFTWAWSFQFSTPEFGSFRESRSNFSLVEKEVGFSNLPQGELMSRIRESHKSVGTDNSILTRIHCPSIPQQDAISETTPTILYEIFCPKAWFVRKYMWAIHNKYLRSAAEAEADAYRDINLGMRLHFYRQHIVRDETSKLQTKTFTARSWIM